MNEDLNIGRMQNESYSTVALYKELKATEILMKKGRR